MDGKMMEWLGDKGFRYYNCLREFYDAPERMEILDYIVRYATEESVFLGADDEHKFREIARRRGYIVAKQLYEENVQRLRAGNAIPALLNLPTNEQIREELQKKYESLEKRL